MSHCSPPSSTFSRASRAHLYLQGCPWAKEVESKLCAVSHTTGAERKGKTKGGRGSESLFPPGQLVGEAVITSQPLAEKRVSVLNCGPHLRTGIDPTVATPPSSFCRVMLTPTGIIIRPSFRLTTTKWPMGEMEACCCGPSPTSPPALNDFFIKWSGASCHVCAPPTGPCTHVEGFLLPLSVYKGHYLAAPR